jgi:UDP-N-acetylglucosamine 2-epimerase (non-hydrolysing)
VKLLSVVGTRPNFMKLAPLARALAARRGVKHVVVHTGQHYDVNMSDAFFSDLALAPPEYHLAVGAASAPAQTAAVITGLEQILKEESPDQVVVYGDVTSTLAAAVVAAQLRIPVAHVEAGLRSNDRTMPEEMNRIVTDHLADTLFAPSRDAVANLTAEGICGDRVHLVGNIMIDTLVHALPRARRLALPASLGLADGEYIVVTLHRPSNVDDPERLRELMDTLVTLSRERTVVFPVHPRTLKKMSDLGLQAMPHDRLRLIDPIAYTEMLSLVESAGLVITDSGGLQEETTFLGVPCITVRPNTERPITCEQGTNRLAPPKAADLVGAARDAFGTRRSEPPKIELWDGDAAARIAAVLCGGIVSVERHAPTISRDGTLRSHSRFTQAALGTTIS